MISTIGFVLTILAALLLATNHMIFGGWLVIWAGCCDFLDGRVARLKNMQTQSGAFYDSVLDRYMDFAVLIALAYRFAADKWVLALVYVALLGAVTTPYIKAKSESLGIASSGGEMQRPERVTILGIGAMLSGYLACLVYPFLDRGEEFPPYLLIAALVIVALASNKVSFERFWATFKALQQSDKRS
jgi:phosphatidylglycerophosphate synthase